MKASFVAFKKYALFKTTVIKSCEILGLCSKLELKLVTQWKVRREYFEKNVFERLHFGRSERNHLLGEQKMVVMHKESVVLLGRSRVLISIQEASATCYL